MVFHALQQRQIRAIADIQIKRLALRLAAQNLQIQVSDAAQDLLGEAGFDPVYGARPLKRAIQVQLETPLAKAILAGSFNPESIIQVDCKEGELTFSQN